MKQKNILLMRGLIRESRHWRDFPALLQKALPGHKIHTLNIPGNGDLNKLRSFTTIRQNVLFLRDQWRKKIDYPSDNTIVALSLGGMIAMEWVTLFPEDWTRLVLMNTSHGGLSPFYHRLRLSNIPKFVQYGLTRNTLKREEIIYDLTVADATNKATITKEWEKISKSSPVSVTNTLNQIWAAAKYRSSTKRPSLPTTIISSKADRLVSPLCSEKLSASWGIPLTIHEKGGHEISTDAPEWVVDEIVKNINQ